MRILAPGRRTPGIAILLTLAAVLALLCAGSLSLQDSGGVDRAAPDGSHYLASVEALDSGEAAHSDSEYLTTLLLSSFLVSLGLLLGAGLVGRFRERSLLEALRLAPVIPLAPARPPLSALEVFRL